MKYLPIMYFNMCNYCKINYILEHVSYVLKLHVIIIYFYIQLSTES